MAFKRDGDDPELLNILKKRRVDELLSYDIPEDEGYLMKNGRLACMVCPHRPVFDTINMLAIHRLGKKHFACEERRDAERLDLEVLKLKREHEQFARDGKVTTTELQRVLGPSKSHGSLLASTPYDSRVKKRKLKPHDRRPVLDITGPSEPVATSSNSLPGNSGTFTSGYSNQRDQHSNHAYKEKNGGRSYKNAGNNLKSSGSHSSTGFHGNPEETVAPQTIAEYRKYKKFSSPSQSVARPYVKKSVERIQYGGVGKSDGSPFSNVTAVASNTTVSTAIISTSGLQKQAPGVGYGRKSHKHLVHRHVHSKNKPKTEKVLGKLKPAESMKTVDEEAVRKAQEYLHYRGGGWKKDWVGKWVKDEDAEFDSDEEPPDLP